MSRIRIRIEKKEGKVILSFKPIKGFSLFAFLGMNKEILERGVSISPQYSYGDEYKNPKGIEKILPEKGKYVVSSTGYNRDVSLEHPFGNDGNKNKFRGISLNSFEGGEVEISFQYISLETEKEMKAIIVYASTFVRAIADWHANQQKVNDGVFALVKARIAKKPLRRK